MTAVDSKKRVVTSIVVIPPLLLLIIYGSVTWFFLLILVVDWLALKELFGMSTLSGEKRLKALTVSLSSFLILVTYFSGIEGMAGAFLITLFFLFLVILFEPNNMDTVLPRLGFGVFGIFYIGFLLSYLIMIRSLDQGIMIILFLLTVVCSNDTFAYYVGKNMGSRKLFPRVSPNKTVEGAAAGVIGGYLTSILFKIYLFDTLSYIDIIILPFILCVTAQSGDLFESLIKRGAGVKDTGSLLPGHGGILDRIDGILFTAPILYYYSLWSFN